MNALSAVRVAFELMLLQLVAAVDVVDDTIVDSTVNLRLGKCPSNPEVEGYTSITNINLDQRDRLSLIASSQNAGVAVGSAKYEFVLCPFTTFDTTDAPLRVLLDNSTFICGKNGVSVDSCVLSGGEEQVQIEDSILGGYILQRVTFLGFTFSSFTDKSILAAAHAPLVTAFNDAVWVDFNSINIVEQQVSGGFGMVIQIDTAMITNGTNSADLFFNVGGALDITNLEVMNVTADSVLHSTRSASASLKNSSIRNSSFNSVTITEQSSAQFIQNVTVSRMNSLDEAFLVKGSDFRAEGVNIEDNEIPDTRPSLKGFVMKESSFAQVVSSTFSQNIGVDNGFSSQSSSSLSLSSIEISGNSGRGPTSSLLYSDEGGIVTADGTRLANNSGFTAQFFAIFGGILNFDDVCISSGESSFVGFVGKGSSYTRNKLFIAPSISSTTCPGGGGRLAAESDDPSSNCFVDTCDVDCVSFSNVVECSGDFAQTFSPPAAPTTVPTESISFSPSEGDTQVLSFTPSITPTGESIVTFGESSSLPTDGHVRSLSPSAAPTGEPMVTSNMPSSLATDVQFPPSTPSTAPAGDSFVTSGVPSSSATVEVSSSTPSTSSIGDIVTSNAPSLTTAAEVVSSTPSVTPLGDDGLPVTSSSLATDVEVSSSTPSTSSIGDIVTSNAPSLTTAAAVVSLTPSISPLGDDGLPVTSSMPSAALGSFFMRVETKTPSAALSSPSLQPNIDSPSNGEATTPSSASNAQSIAFISPSASNAPSNLPSASNTPSNLPSASDAPSTSNILSMTQSDYLSNVPSVTAVPSSLPSDIPSWIPSSLPSSLPSSIPSSFPSVSIVVSNTPSLSVSITPSTKPSDYPSNVPSLTTVPSPLPSDIPSRIPSLFPSLSLSEEPSSSSISSGDPTVVASIPPPTASIVLSSTPSITKSSEPSNLPTTSNVLVSQPVTPPTASPKDRVTPPISSAMVVPTTVTTLSSLLLTIVVSVIQFLL